MSLYACPSDLLPGDDRAQNRLRIWFGQARRSLRAYEKLTLAYLAFLNGLILLFPHNVACPGALVAGHTVVALAVVALCWAAECWSHPGLRFWRHWYPFLLFIGFFEELHFIVHLLRSGWQDAALIAFDYALFGAHPTLWLESLAGPVLNDAMAFFYMTYYLFTVTLAGVLYRDGQLAAFRQTLLATATAYTCGYLIALAFPVEGPFHTMAALQQVKTLAGGPFTAVMDVVQGAARVHGAAFPSLHVAGSTVAVLAAWRFERRLFWIFLPFLVGMCAATVYGRYHYFVDIPAGMLLGALGDTLARRWEPAQEKCGTTFPQSRLWLRGT
jgi:membrane-associated phospholipid phosphatase